MFWTFTSTAWRSWLFLAVMFGGFVGVGSWLEGASTRFVLVIGATLGILFATHMLLSALRRPLSVLRDLPGDDRVAVICAVRRGGSVHDSSRSAEALIAYAGALRQEYEATDRCQGLFGLMAMLSVIVVIWNSY